MAEGDDFRIAHLAAIIDRSMAVDIEDDIIALARDRADDAQIGLIAGRKDHCMVHVVKFAQRRLDIAVRMESAVQDAAAGGASAKVVKRLLACSDDILVKGHAHIVVGAEQDRLAAVADGDGRRQNLFHHQIERVSQASFEQRAALFNQRIEFGEKVGHINP